MKLEEAEIQAISPASMKEGKNFPCPEDILGHAWDYNIWEFRALNCKGVCDLKQVVKFASQFFIKKNSNAFFLGSLSLC